MTLKFQSPHTAVSEIPALKRFKLNKLGRDFVVGDMHGCYSIFMKLLDHVQFDPTKDRVFCSGDLIDRGSENEECLRLLKNDWFAATVGNHEFFAIATMHHHPHADYWAYNDGYWATPYVNQLFRHVHDKEPLLSDAAEFWYELYPLIKQMPMMITVTAKKRKKFHVMHAELDFEIFKPTDKLLLDPKFVRRAWSNEEIYGNGADGMWRRSIFVNHVDKQVAEFSTSALSTVYSGHTPQAWNPVRKGNFVCLDTGSFMHRKENYGITMIEHETGQAWMANSFGVTEKIVK